MASVPPVEMPPQPSEPGVPSTAPAEIAPPAPDIDLPAPTSDPAPDSPGTTPDDLGNFA